MEPLVNVSVIVAVYDAEDYLARCLDCLLKQTMQNFEVILVDDGSKDASGKICDEYVKKDSRIKCCHKENGGVSSARQKGLELARGEYVIHVDPDDWIEPTMFSKMYESAKTNNSDMVICDIIVENNHKSRYESQQPTALDNKSVFIDLLTRIHGSCWNKLVRRSLFEKFGICFPKNMVVWEDIYVNCMLCTNPISISYIPEAFYHYDVGINSNSLMNKFSQKKYESMCYCVEQLSTIKTFGPLDEYLIGKKAIIKRNVFLYLNPDKNFLKGVYPEIDSYLFHSTDIVDRLIKMALCRSWNISRLLLFLAKKYSRMKKLCG